MEEGTWLVEQRLLGVVSLVRLFLLLPFPQLASLPPVFCVSLCVFVYSESWSKSGLMRMMCYSDKTRLLPPVKHRASKALIIDRAGAPLEGFTRGENITLTTSIVYHLWTLDGAQTKWSAWTKHTELWLTVQWREQQNDQQVLIGSWALCLYLCMYYFSVTLGINVLTLHWLYCKSYETSIQDKDLTSALLTQNASTERLQIQYILFKQDDNVD